MSRPGLPSAGIAERAAAPPGALSAVLTLGWRAALKIKHVPFQLFDVMVLPIMMTVLFTFLFGGALAGSTGAYLQFLLPGIVVQTVLFLTVYTGVGLNTDVQHGLFDRFRSLPIWQPAPVVGALLGDLARYSLAAMVVVVVGLLLGFRPEAGVGGVLLAVLLLMVFASAMSWLWIIVGFLVPTAESVMTTSFLVIFPLTFISNIFVDPATMPDWLQAVVAANPVTHLTNASRGLMHGGVALVDVAWVLGASAVLTALFAPVAMRLYYRER
ncbi:ABC transporter permease [Spiribacter halobius]|uniref:Transport permease protein n=1 Tax=Sediminicurvatus halobius TaxID=2182432 RepID=A0A2U2N482_9GAMM|nr:ABC transporter permease [Spiribacter halobius]PWG63892.1 ABC transporter [Spiribacter halobius]UEX76302.1 ABC transporter permease [Spiribacter halobius]